MFHFADGGTVMEYDVHPQSQEDPVNIPDGAVGVSVWLGVTSRG
jgi:hypothetical protein